MTDCARELATDSITPRQPAVQQTRLEMESGEISPRHQVEVSPNQQVSYPLTGLGEDENDNLTVTGSDGKHDTLTSKVRIDFRKFSEAAVEQTVILSWRQHSLVRP